MTHFMAAFAVAFTFALQSANAQDDVGRWYVGAGIGETKADDFCDIPILSDPTDPTFTVTNFTLTNCDNKDTSAKLYGGYNLHKNFAVEGGYIDFGEYQWNDSFEYQLDLPVVDSFGRVPDFFGRSRSTIKESINSFFFAGIGKIHVHPKITLFGKIGLHRWNVDVQSVSHTVLMQNGVIVDDNLSNITGDFKDTDYFYGIGGEAAPFSNQKIKLRMEYEMFEFDGNRYLEFLGLGITYTF